MSTETIRDTRYEIGVLTGALVKVDAYRYAFPDWTVTHIPSEFSEHEIKYEAPYHPLARVGHIAEAKLVGDRTAATAFLGVLDAAIDGRYDTTDLVAGTRRYILCTDTLQLLHVDSQPEGAEESYIYLEKPDSVEEWLGDPIRGPTAIRGRWVEVVTAISAIDAIDFEKPPRVIFFRTRVKMKNFTDAELFRWFEDGGREIVTQTAGGLPIAQASSLYDKSTPLTVYRQH